MKKNSCFANVACLAIAAGIYANSTFPAYSDTEFKVVTNVTQKAEFLLNLKTLEVDNRFGPLRVIGIDDGPGGWTWKLTVRARTDALAQKAVAESSIKPQRDGDNLRLVVSLPKSDGKTSFTSDLEIRVPKSVAVQTHNSFGTTDIFDLNAAVEATGQNGSVKISKVGGKVRAKTSFATLKVSDTGPATLQNQNGLIDATDIRGSLDAATSFASLVARDIAGPVKLRNQNGRVEATKAGDADIKTSFAELKVKNIKGIAKLANQNGSINASEITGDVKADTSFATMEIKSSGTNFVCRNQNGSIRLHASSAALATIDAKTSFATLELHLPAKMKPAIQAHTSFAEVESEFPVLLKPRGQDPFAGVDPGTPRITLQNQNGKIRVMGE